MVAVVSDFDQRDLLVRNQGGLAPLHRPLGGDDTFKGGLHSPTFTGKPTGLPTGWVCPKCGTANAPSQPTCFACSVKRSE